MCDHAKQRCLACAVRPDDSDNSARRQSKSHVIDEQAIAEGLTHLFGFDHNVPKTRARWNINLQIARMLFTLLTQQTLVGCDSRFALCMSAFRRHADPLQFALQSLLSF